MLNVIYKICNRNAVFDLKSFTKKKENSMHKTDLENYIDHAGCQSQRGFLFWLSDFLNLVFDGFFSSFHSSSSS